MSRLRVRHVTGYQYGGGVTQSYNEARMLPGSGDGQFVLAANLEISPISSSQAYVDYWGTRVNSFEILTPHDELSLTATSLVEVQRAAHAEPGLSWTDLGPAAQASVDTVEQLQQTRLTEPPEEVVAIARAAAADLDPCAAALAVCREIHRRVVYMAGVTGVQSTAQESWEHGRGVCQDIAHIAIGALRAIGVPARYVSGYLHPDPAFPIGTPVTGESHAWVEWFCGSWHGFDPTNDLPIGERHVLVGRGRDYADVAPLRGVYAGPFGSRLFVEVEITREA
ncbi:transglutaminase family protein [Amnibacterium kyonggiense]|uniref:Transglutaminase-like putative cysteine protease n=1 Tax=Amnibacterium kyonggiense TaxID=595671 RepID=A0A4R7FPS7_9MICO|nr:transglutaminase family protein [Amnibacterium kyonggiense]TDS79761.1 transglutaminase-like putative cysteine protease [Amnibacterium kyonggiense]